MVLQPVLLITDLIPSEARDAACALHTGARGSLGGVAVDVVLADRDALVAGGEDALHPLLSPLPREIRLTTSCSDPGGDAWLQGALDTLAPTVPRVLSDADDGPDVTPLVLEDLGVLTRDLFSNGVRWVARTDPGVVRPDRLTGPLDGRVGDALATWWARCGAAWGEDTPPARAAHLRLEGAGLFDATMSPWRVADAIARSPLELRFVELAADDPAAVRRAADLVLRLGLLRPAAPEATLVIDGQRRRPAELLESLPVGDREQDDQLRRAIFHTLSRMPPELRDVATRRAEAALGPAKTWIAAFQRFARQGMPWITLIPTWQCELRCVYCGIVKQGGREMREATVDAALDMLLASDQDDVAIHFFGGEPFMNWPAMRRAISEGERRVTAQGRRIHFLITTNGYAVTEEQLDWLARFDVSFELSLDGDPATMATFRHGRDKGDDTYLRGVAGKARWFHERGMPHTVIQVVHPDNVGQMVDNFRHILDLGFRTLQLNFAVGPRWDDEALAAWAEGLHGLGAELERRWARGEDVMVVNLQETLRSFRVNLHPTVDWDGTVYAGTPFLYMEGNKPTFRLGHLDDGASVQRYVVDSLHVEDVYANWSLKGSAAETRRVGTVQKSFIRWMRARHPDRLPAEATPLGATARARERERGERRPTTRTA